MPGYSLPINVLWLHVRLWRLRRIDRALAHLRARHSAPPSGSSIESMKDLRHEFDRLAIRRELLRARIESAR